MDTDGGGLWLQLWIERPNREAEVCEVIEVLKLREKKGMTWEL